MHFCVFTTRGHGALAEPRKYGLNWFIPALVNSSVGSSCGTTELLGTNVWLCFLTKKSMYAWRISFEVMTRSFRSSVERRQSVRNPCHPEERSDEGPRARSCDDLSDGGRVPSALRFSGWRSRLTSCGRAGRASPGRPAASHRSHRSCRAS